MKYQSSISKTIYDLDFDLSHKKRYKCPVCSNSRKKKNQKDLEYYPKTKTAYCFHCENTFFEYKPYETQKEYKVPEWRNKTKLSDKLVKYFTSRMISQDTLVKMKVFSDMEWMPQFEKEIECICFPYFVDNKQKNIKFRGANKSFKLVSGAELIWYNFNALTKNKEIILVEGEIDALTWIENGFDNVVSVPNGANVGTMDYLDNSIKLFNEVERVYLNTDTDEKGIVLRDEFIRRLGAEKCYLINTKQYKDANDYFCAEGGIEFKKLIQDSKPAPIKGIITIDSLHNEILDLYEKGETKGKTIGVDCLDNSITWELGRLAIVTGVPGSGKSEFIDYLTTKLNLLYGWKVAYFTPENYPLKYHYRKLHSKFSGKKFEKATDTTNFYNIYEKIKDNFFYIMNEDDLTVKSIMESAKALVKQKGIKILVLDPYNKFEHQQGNISETQYISKFLDIITNFAKFNNVLVLLVAHPRKIDKNEVPSLYDIAGSANFYNKTDYGITVHRQRSSETNVMNNNIDVHIQKVKFKHLGEQGLIEMVYNYNNGRFEPMNYDINTWDNSNWLEPNKVEPNLCSIDALNEITTAPF